MKTRIRRNHEGLSRRHEANRAIRKLEENAGAETGMTGMGGRKTEFEESRTDDRSRESMVINQEEE